MNSGAEHFIPPVDTLEPPLPRDHAEPAHPPNDQSGPLKVANLGEEMIATTRSLNGGSSVEECVRAFESTSPSRALLSDEYLLK